MTRSREAWRRAAASATLCVAIAIAVGVPAAALADPSETDPKSIARDPDFIAGKWAIDAREWSEAVKRLDRAARRDPDNADLHNYLGFAYRNLGRLEPAFEHYRRALALNPQHRGAHEYAGEAYLLAGNLTKAEEHLEALRRICLVPCEELTDLDREITAYRKRAEGRRP